jgi:hypothetical protein
MSPAEIVTLIGALAATAQLIFTQSNYWESRQRTPYTSATKQPPASYKTDSKFELTERLFSPNKVWSLSLLTLIIYGLLGFHAAVVHASLWFWALAVLINYWNLANLWQRKFCARSRNYLVKTLLAAQVMPSAISIAGIVWASTANLPSYLPVAVGLATGINSVAIVAVFTKSFVMGKAITLATGLSYSGFVLGWVVQIFSLY